MSHEIIHSLELIKYTAICRVTTFFLPRVIHDYCKSVFKIILNRLDSQRAIRGKIYIHYRNFHDVLRSSTSGNFKCTDFSRFFMTVRTLFMRNIP